VIAAAAPAPRAARDQAREILSEERFQEPAFPTPFKGFFEWLGERLQPILDAVGGLLGKLAGPLPGGRALLLGVLAALALVAIAALFSREVRRRQARSVAVHGASSPSEARADARELERLAAAAEGNGDLQEAVRLRFRAGLTRLDDRGAIRMRPSLTTGEVARRLRSQPFERLAGDFDEIVYGGREAEPTDVDVARAEWPRVLSETDSR